MKFHFEAPARGRFGAKNWTKELKCGQCTAVNEDGIRCSRRVCVGKTMCWQHSRIKLHLKVDKSKIPNAGKGLFAIRTQKKGLTAEQLRKPVFKKGENIVKYRGEEVSKNQLDQRYGDWTAPYALQIGNGGPIVDAALDRGIAAMANHKPKSRANAKLSETGYIKAKKPILDGAEIYVTYGDQREKDAFKFEPQVKYSTK